jgi:putative nucleotidyltransferase with HDIG domain
VPVLASGFVLCRPLPGRFLYLTLTNARHGDVGAPKGHADGGEDLLATAVREAAEETGLPVIPARGFRRVVRYPEKGRTKEVTYFAARTEREDVRLSDEHSSFAWLDLDATLAAIRHENLRQVFRDAAAWLKDPILRRDLDPAAARALLERETGTGAPVVAHSAQVADMARTMAEALGADASYVEAAAWLHDVGRARTQETRHTLEGFRLLAARGHAGYAPPCLSHYLKGRAPEDFVDAALAGEMRESCDLDTFPPEERIIALADFLAAGARRVRPEERHADLVRRYGPSAFVDGSLAIARTLQREFEEASGTALDRLLGL